MIGLSRNGDRGKLLKILEEAGASNLIGIIEDDSARESMCWVDGVDCSYANPQGRFVLAPIELCAECQRFNRDATPLSKIKELANLLDFNNNQTATAMSEEAIEEFLEKIEPEMETIACIIKELTKYESEFVVEFSEIIIKKLELENIRVVREKNLDSMAKTKTEE